MTGPTHDLHVHSTWSDGRSHPIENIAAAAKAGLTSLAMVDHVGLDTAWVPLFADEVSWFREMTDLDLIAGVEAKLLDTEGTLDAPRDLDGIDVILVADHQFPTRFGLRNPAELRAPVATGLVSRSDLVTDLVDALLGAATTPRVQIAHLFSVLPKAGLSEADVPAAELDRLAEGLARAGVAVEISERWRCPSAHVALVLADAGVRLVASTDSHRATTIGRFDYVLDVLHALEATPEDLNHDFEQWRSLWT